MILVTGATGTIGRELVRMLSARRVPTRAFVRSSAGADRLRLPHVEIATGDLADAASLDAALQGVERVFLLSPADPNQIDLQQNVIDASRRANVRHLVKLSAYGADVNSTVSMVRWHARTEEAIKESGLPYTFLRPHSFMQNLLASAPSIKAERVLYAPMKDAAVPLIDARDIAIVATNVLTEEGHVGKTYDLTGPENISYTRVAGAISDAIGQTVTYVDVTPTAARDAMLASGMPEWLTSALIQLWALYTSASKHKVSKAVVEIGRIAPKTFAEFARDHASAFK